MAQDSTLKPAARLEKSRGAPRLAVPAGTAEDLDGNRIVTRVSSPGKDAWRRFRGNWAAMISLVIVCVFMICAVFAPLLHTTNPISTNGPLDAGPGSRYWFGTDGVGRDIYSRLMFGLRVPLVVGLIGTSVTVVIGTLLGVSAGFLVALSIAWSPCDGLVLCLSVLPACFARRGAVWPGLGSGSWRRGQGDVSPWCSPS